MTHIISEIFMGCSVLGISTDPFRCVSRDMSYPGVQASKDSMKLSIGPLEISGYAMALLVMAVYVPGSPYMYMNMVSNRRGAFKKRKAAVNGKKLK